MEMDWDRSVSGEIREESWSAVREVEISRADQGYLSWGGFFLKGVSTKEDAELGNGIGTGSGHTSTRPHGLGSTIPLQCHRLEGLVCIGDVVCVDGLQRLWDGQGAVHGLGFDGAGPLLRGAAAHICIGFIQEGHIGVVGGHDLC